MDGISLIPSHGSHTQNIPPITSVSDNRVNSAAGIFFDAIEYKIKPRQTKVPCKANNASFFPDDKIFELFEIKTANETIKHIKPARATVVNLGVSFLHLKLTENIEKPIAEVRPKINQTNVFFS